jgi:ubiquinone/menaquinone biosynthesis C-methylase UbiE
MNIEPNVETIFKNKNGVGQFTDVDEDPDPRWFIDFMDIANSRPEYISINQSLVKAMSSNIAPKRILDLGSGTGDDTRQLFSVLKNVEEIVGVDRSAMMVNEARRRCEGMSLPITFRQEDGSHLNFPDSYFDAARAKLVLMHVEDINTTLKELIRVVRAGGRIAIFDFDFDTTIVDHPNVSVTRKILERFSDRVKNNWSGRQLLSRFTSNHMNDINVEPFSLLFPFQFFKRTFLSRSLGIQPTKTPFELKDEEEWWNVLEKNDLEGTFFASITGFVGSCSKPF